MSQARFSVRTAVAEGFDFWRRNALKAVGPLAIAAAAAFAATLLQGRLALIALAVNFIALVMAQGALYRLALEGAGAEPADRNGPLGLQWRWLETRLAMVIILLLLVLAISATVMVFFLVVALLGIVGGEAAITAASPEALMAGLSPMAVLAFNSGVLLAFLGLLVVIMRLAMAAPATAATGRLQFLRTLPLTRGSVMRLMLAVLLVNLPIFAVQGLAWGYIRITGEQGFAPWADGVTAALTPAFFIPIAIGMTSYIYLRLRGDHG
ncbi:MAG: hypothetical protein Q8L23_02930 [Caulobacter sp.]|nr:hypothetical protein [Caulobacter sp.]